MAPGTFQTATDDDCSILPDRLRYGSGTDPAHPTDSPLMINSLTRSRSADFHRSTMLRLIIAAGLLYLLWEPIRPVRLVTADLLHTTGDLIAR